MPCTPGNLLITNGRLIDPARGIDDQLDLLIVDGHVAASGRNLEAPQETTLLEAGGLVVCPGFIDSHVHLREPGFEHKETMASASAAALAGGICSVVAMPNTEPPPDNSKHLADILRRAEDVPVRVYSTGCITQDRAGTELAPLAELASAGAVAFSDDGDPVQDENIMRQALQTAHHLGIPIFPHEEVKHLTAGGCMHEGNISRRLGLTGMPAAAEEQMIARDIELVRKTAGPLHVAHISSSGALDLISRAKKEGLPVTCEVLPHHFILTDTEVENQGTAAKMSPPLRGNADVAAMRAGLAGGIVEVISSDHAPHTDAEKQQGMNVAPFGIVGLETAIGLTLTHLVQPGILGLIEAIAKWTCNPARILRLPGGRLSRGDPGDVTLIDLQCNWRVNPTDFRSKSCNTPFGGSALTGKAVATVIGGRLVYRDRQAPEGVPVETRSATTH